MSRMKTKNRLLRTLLMIIIFFLILAGFRIAFLKWQEADEQPDVVNGIFDMTDYQFPFDKPMHLNGDWHFFSGEFVDPSTVQNRVKDATSIEVPTNWKHAFSTSEDLHKDYQLGTYYLQIILPQTISEDTNNLFSFYFQDIYTDSTIYINGEETSSISSAVSSSSRKPQSIQPLTTDFITFDQTIDLVIHVSSPNHFPLGGINQSVRFGTKFAIDSFQRMYEVLQLIAIVVLLIQLLYAFVYFRMSERKKEITYYTLLLFTMILTILFDDSYLITTLIPLSFEGLFTGRIISYIGISILILLFSYSITPGWFNRKLYLALLTMNSVFLISVIILPFGLASYFFYASFLSTITAAIFIGFTHVKKMVTDSNYSRILIIASISILSSTIWGTLFNFSSIHINYYPFEMILALAALGFYMLERSNANSKATVKLNERLQEANEIKDFFIVSTTHELRNPLQSVINISENIVNQSSIDEQTKNKIELILAATNHMRATLNDFYDMSLMQAEEMVLHRKPISVKAVAAGVVDMLSYFIPSDKVLIQMNIPDDFPLIDADENRLTQILFNLIHNAIKFTNEGSIIIHAKTNKDMASISVTDTGIGIAEDLQDSIFEPYVYHTNAAGRRGIGVGLSVCKKLVVLHGGTIDVSSTETDGTTFTFTIPLAKANLDHHISTDEPLDPAYIQHIPAFFPDLKKGFTTELSFGKAKLLIVDDDPLNMEVISNILSDDYHITMAQTGEEALQYIQKQSFDLMIADVMMPNMSGYELTIKVRELYTLSELPIIIFTARHLPEDIYTGFAAGANDYVTKPVNALELQTRIQSLLTLKDSIDKRLHLESAWLHAQIKPHFIFNTINSIISLSYIDQERMLELLDKFSIYLRSSFEPLHEHSLIPISDEMNLVKAYVGIQKERFLDRLHIHWDIDDKLDIKVPPFSLQTLVENSISHGILAQAKSGNVWIRVKKKADSVLISIEDDGVGMDEDLLASLLSSSYVEGQGIGLMNTNARIQKAFGAPLSIRSYPGEGTVVSFTVPFHMAD